MLPIFRILPIGGVFLAVAILLLALQPPRATPPLAPTLLAERGPLIDRDTHPELRQFLVLAALHRANAVERLLAIPETHIPPAPLPRNPQVGLSLSTPVPATLFSPEAAPVVAPAPGPKVRVPEEAKAAPQAETKPPILDSAVVKPTPAATAAPVIAAAPAATPAKSSDKKPPAVAVVALPRPRPPNDNGAVTASIGTNNESPRAVHIGRASAPELPVTLPRERPAALRKLRYRPLHEAKLKPRHTAKRHHEPKYAPLRRAHRRKPMERKHRRKAAQPSAGDSFDLFTAMFGSPPQPSIRNRKGQP